MPKYDYDLITIGAGSGGVRASRRAAATGARVAIVENLRFGGTCVMRGCVPKKLLVYAGHFADDFEDSGGYGWENVNPGFDWPALIEAKNKELYRLEAVYHRILGEAGVEEVFATATVADPHTVEVDGKSLTAETLLVATGGWPKMPDIPGIEHVITSNEALDLPELPDRIAIIGGGYIAVEFAGIFNSLGAQVTEIIRASQILRGFDGDVRGVLAEEMEKKGIDIRRETEVEEIAKDVKGDGGGFSLKLKDGGTIEADLVMYATGRAPNTRGMGLEESGVELDEKSAVCVDEFSRSSVENIYAIGDVTERMNLTPVAIAEAEAMVRTAFGGKPMAVDYSGVPSAVFSQPPIGTVGLTEAEAGKQTGGEIDVYVSRFTPMKYTLSGRDEKSMMKLVVERNTDRVLGCHMVGLDAPEIIQGFAVALRTGATKAHFDATIGIHPTAGEEFFTLREKRG
ncbi:MAG TPA: glutathione-disulfide reductase [Rhodospirillales bacterium]|jgi:glutathione reductase (NADPH)|nr:glutathione-disulfide reductase [Rhodospirillales bacterium]